MAPVAKRAARISRRGVWRASSTFVAMANAYNARARSLLGRAALKGQDVKAQGTGLGNWPIANEALKGAKYCDVGCISLFQSLHDQ